MRVGIGALSGERSTVQDCFDIEPPPARLLATRAHTKSRAHRPRPRSASYATIGWFPHEKSLIQECVVLVVWVNGGESWFIPGVKTYEPTITVHVKTNRCCFIVSDTSSSAANDIFGDDLMGTLSSRVKHFTHLVSRRPSSRLLLIVQFHHEAKLW